jgi:Tripartite tricarboxylate transporter TctB family
MMRAEIIFPAVLFAAVAALLAAGFFVYKYSWTVIGFPLGAGILVCTLCLVDIVMTMTGHRPRPAGEAQLEPLSLACVLWVFALAAFILTFGFVFGPAAYLLVYLLATGSSWRLSAAIATGSLLMTWALFIKLLRVPVPLEPLWWPW